MDLGIAGRAALVMGGSGAIGQAVASGLIQAGVRVAIAGRSRPTVEAAVHGVSRLGGPVFGMTGDCARTAEVERLVHEAREALGDIEILVNAAGAARAGEFTRLAAEDWAESLDVKLMGAIAACRVVVPHMRAQRWGRIVNIGGTSWQRPSPQSMPGAVANAGLVNFTKALAQMCAADGVLVNAVNPGHTDTGRLRYLIEHRARLRGISLEAARQQYVNEIPLGRLGRAEEIAHVVVFLTSELASFVTGAVINVDGGTINCL